ncbi:SDR family oxidoreductase [Leptolyngbya sp. FACHB-261]|uniref:SDR family NAD(P)-dependent oxidoreductase n=1 Tax=Leptolyngbya sp. FACHB-261 TaxID=2692806 RepID=UPI001688EED7|nr:SDR family oxidoreductase [Leptolyngbya sp. FACHB-261]MBD2102512.1 SDR family oxidoreductase [Leptolyngbya sp. FACHB-261]
MNRFVIFGASWGLGEVFHRFVPESGDKVWLVSRAKPTLHLEDQIERIWIETDLAKKGASQVVSSAIAAEELDTAIYNAGIWETLAFTEQYKFEDVTDEENERILTINLVTAISCIKALLPNLRLSQNPKIILVGSANSHDYVSGQAVAYAASKFGLRGVVNALKQGLRQEKTGITLLNPGTFGTIRFHQDKMEVEPVEGYDGVIAPQDLVTVMECIIKISRESCIRDIDIVAMLDPF